MSECKIVKELEEKVNLLVGLLEECYYNDLVKALKEYSYTSGVDAKTIAQKIRSASDERINLIIKGD